MPSWPQSLAEKTLYGQTMAIFLTISIKEWNYNSNPLLKTKVIGVTKKQYDCVILHLYNCSINKKLILSKLHFKHNIETFSAPALSAKIVLNKATV